MLRFVLLFCVVIEGVGGYAVAVEEIDILAKVYRDAVRSNKIVQWDFVHCDIATVPATEKAGNNPKEMIDAARSGVDLFNLPGVNGTEAIGSMRSDSYRFNLKIRCKLKWVNGASEWISIRSQRCFDGKIIGSVGRSLPGSLFPEDTDKPDPNCATVADIGTSTQEKRNVDLDVGKSGLWAFFPQFPTPYLSDKLFMSFDEFIDACSKEHSDKLKLSRESSGILHVEGMPTRSTGKTADYLYRYSVFENGRVQNIEIKASDGTIVKSATIKYSGEYPEAVAVMDWVSGRGSRTTFSNVTRLNEVTDSFFQVTIPDGALVNDSDRRVQYTAGVTTEEEIRRLAEFVGKNKLIASPSRNNPFWISMVVLTPLVLLSCYLFKRRASSLKRQHVLFVPLFLLATASCHGGEPVWDGRDWRVDLGGAEQIRIRQCGFSAATIVLTLLAPQFDPFLTAKYLEPTREGVRMDRIKSIFEAYGLETNAYKKSSISKVVNALSSDEVAVLAISKHGISNLHYVVVATDERGRRLFVDYPLEPVDIGTWSEREKAEISECVVLICRKAKLELPHSASLKETELSLGSSEFVDGSYSGNVVLINDSDKPIVCTEIVKSCTCVQLTSHQFQGFVLDSKSKVEIGFRLKHEDFVGRSQPARIQFRLANGQNLDFMAKVQEVASHEGKVSPQSSRIKIEADSRALRNGVYREKFVSLPWLSNFDLGSIRLEHPDWLRVDTTLDGLRLLPSLDSDFLDLLIHRGAMKCSIDLYRIKDDLKLGEVECELVVVDVDD